MTKKYQLIIQPEAEKGITEGYLWFSNYSPRKARAWLEGLYKVIQSLEKMPNRCAFAIENNFFSEEIRQIIYGKYKNAYRILFTLNNDTVYILFVRHTAQKPLRDKNKEEE